MFLKNTTELQISAANRIQTCAVPPQECAMETLDPKAKEFSQERKALLAQRQQMEEQLDGLRGSQRVGGGG